MKQSHISGCFVYLPHDILRRLLYERVGGCGGPEGAEKENYKYRFHQPLRSYVWDAEFRWKDAERVLTNAVSIGRRRAERISAF